MKQRISISLLFCVVLSLSVAAQEIHIHASHQPLNEVLITLRDSSGLQVSFNDELLSKYIITIDDHFSNPEDAIAALLSDKNLTFERLGNVFLILPKEPEPEVFHFSGIVKEGRSGEPLPYAHVIIGDRKLATDLRGAFTYSTTDTCLLPIKISYLGYYILDTTIASPGRVTFNLTSATIGLREVIIVDKLIERSAQIGELAGVIRLNQKIATFLPGNTDNSVFNLLRLHPGILAAGESSNDLIIWGSYEGQSQVLFDGFTIFGLKNFNDNISAVNPLITKDIEVLKGGYNAKYGHRVGGIVNITGITGNKKKESFNLNINNLTLNSVVEIPIKKRSSLVLAYRRTFYDLYEPFDFTISRSQSTNGNALPIDLRIIPDYTFRDMNAKFSTQKENGDLFFISLFQGKDKFQYNINNEITKNRTIEKATSETNSQFGGSLYYGKSWAKRSKSSLTMAVRRLNSTYSDSYVVTTQTPSSETIRTNDNTYNNVAELKTVLDHQIAFNKSHMMEGGLEFIYNNVELLEDSFDVNQVNITSQATRSVAFLQDHIHLGSKLIVTPGIRINHPGNIQELYTEPRISATYSGINHVKINMATGRYYQFVSKSSVVDNAGNYRYNWVNSDKVNIPVLQSNHYVISASYAYNNWLISLEGFHKNTDGLTRFINRAEWDEPRIFTGKSKSSGLDFYVKKEYHGHSIWVAYSLSRTLEYFPYFVVQQYRRAPQDQRHEIKTALLIDLKPVYLSTNYVFGSGLPVTLIQVVNEDIEAKPYSRLDVAATYAFSLKRINFEAGVSILNVLNTENIKYSNFERVAYTQTSSITILSEAIPFTPTINFKIYF